MSNIQELTEWCHQARRLIGYDNFLNPEAQSMTQSVREIDIQLGVLDPLTTQTELRASFVAEYEVLSRRAQDIVARGRGDSAHEAERIKEVKVVYAELSALRTRVNEIVPLAKARENYLNALLTCENKRDGMATQPHANLGSLNAVIQRAKAQAGNQMDVPALESAYATLQTFEKLRLKAEATRLATVELERAQRAAMPGCLDKLQAAKALLVEMETSGIGVDAQKAKLAEELARIEMLLKTENWLGATSVLDTMPTRAACLEASNKALNSAKGRFPDVQKGRQALDILKTLMDAEFTQPFEERLRKAIDDVARAEMDPRAPELLTSTAQVIDNYISWARAQDAALGRQIDALAVDMEKLRALTPAVEMPPLIDASARIGNDRAQKQIVAAQDRATELAVRIAAALETWTGHKAAWDGVKSEVDAMLAELQTQSVDASAPLDLREAAVQQKARLSATAPLVALRDWPALVALHAGVKFTIDGFDARKTAYERFAEARAAAQTRAQASLLALRTSLAALESGLSGAGVRPEKLLAPLRKTQATIAAGWEQKYGSATTDAELDLTSTLAAIAQLHESSAGIGTEGGLAVAQADQVQDEARIDFEAKRAALERSLDTLDDLDSRQAQALRTSAAAVAAGADNSWPDRLSALEAVASAATTAIAGAKTESDATKSRMTARCVAVQLQFDTQWDTLKSGKGAKFKPLFDALREDLADLTELSVTPNCEAAKANEAELDRLQVRLDELAGLSADGQDPFQLVINELARLKTSFATADTQLKDNVPQTLTNLKKRLAKLETDLYSMDISKAWAELGMLRVALNQGRAEASRKQGFRASVVQLIPLLRANLAVMQSNARAPDYYKSLKERFDAAVKIADKPDKLEAAKKQLDKIFQEVQTATINPAEGLKKQKALLDDKQREDLLVTEWTSSLKVFKVKVLPRAAAAVAKPGGDPAQVTEIERMLVLAEEAAGTKDHAEALRRLKLAEQRVAEVEADPTGPGIGSRKALPENARQYSDAVAGLLAALTAFPGQVQPYVSEAPPGVLASISASTIEVRGLFDPTAFHSWAATLNDGRGDVRARRETREAALGKVRSLQALLGGHPVLVELLGNPISPDVDTAAKLLNRRLTTLEANIRRCVH